MAKRLVLAAVGSALALGAGALPASAAERGFELVSPADAMGYSAQGIASQPDGDGFYWQEPGGVQNSGIVPDDQAQGDVFFARRSPTKGWTSDWITRDPVIDGTPVVAAPGSGPMPGMESEGVIFDSPAEVGFFASTTGLFLGTTAGSDLLSAPPGADAAAGLNVWRQWTTTPDLSATVFVTAAGLVASDTDGAEDIYRRDGSALDLVSHRTDDTADNSGAVPFLPAAAAGGTSLGTTSSDAPLDSKSTTGFPVSQGASPVSEDGESIVFSTTAPLDPADTDGAADLYLWHDGQVRLVSDDERSSAGCPGDPGSTTDCAMDAVFVGMSADASTIYFRTVEGLIDDDADGGSDIYRYEVAAPAGQRLTLATGAGSGDALPVSVTRDGKLFFVSSDRLGSAPPAGTSPVIYRWDGFGIQTVAPLTHDDVFTATGNLRGFGVVDTIPNSRAVRATADGDALVFQTAAALDPSDTDASADLYRWREGGGLTLLSGTGAAPVALGSTFGGPQGSGIAIPPVQGRVISADASRAFFVSTDALTADAGHNGRTKLYEFRDGSGISLVSPQGAGAGAVTYVDNSVDGADAFFMTGDALVPGDADGDGVDVYDARVGGGFAVPPAPPAPCVGDACQRVPTTAPGAPTSSTSTFHGLGNVASALAPTSRGVGRIEVRRRRGAVRGVRAIVRVTVPARGALRVSGHGLAVTRRRAHAAGTYRVAVRLSAQARRRLARVHRVRVSARVRFVPQGGRAQTVRVKVTFKTRQRRHEDRAHRAARKTKGMGR